MSEDQTKFLNEDDKQKAPTTEPMLEAILARLNDLTAKMETGFAEIKERLTALEKAVHKLERKFDVFSIESMKIKADVLDVVNRVEDLERKAS